MTVKSALYLATAFSGCLLFVGFARGAELKFNTQDFAPFNYEIGGVVSGPGADIIRRICSDIKIDCGLIQEILAKYHMEAAQLE
jgi:hypothetical protein